MSGVRRIAIIGSNDLGQLIGWHASQMDDFEVVGFVDNRKPKGTPIGTLGKVLGDVDDIDLLYRNHIFDALSIGVGYTQFEFRESVFESLVAKVPFATIVHPSCYVDRSATIGSGSVLLPGCTVDHGAVIGNNVLLNTGCVLAHHATIADHCFIAPAVAVAGYTTVGPRSFVGIHATIIDNVQICADAKIGAGAVVTSDVTSNNWMLGCPAKPQAANRTKGNSCE